MKRQGPPAGRKPRVIYWNNIPAPYMVERFNAVAAGDELDIEAWFNERIEPGRSWDVDESSWRFPYRYLPRLRFGRFVIHLPLPLLFRRRPDLIVSLYAEPSFILGWLLTRLLRVPAAFWCEITFDAWVPRRPWKERLKRWLLPRADATLASGKDGQAFAMRYGVPAARALAVPHVVDVDYFRSKHDAVKGRRETLRSDLGLSGVTYLYVGRLWLGKGLDTLIDAFAQLQDKPGEPVSLLLAGDGPDEDVLRRRCAAAGLHNVVFAGFQQKNDLPRYYALADVFVFPTLGDPYGLVVDEAMACSLPIISSTAAGEIGERVRPGVNGWLVRPNDVQSLTDAMQALRMDAGLRTRMGAESARIIAGRTPHWWAAQFAAVARQIISQRQAAEARA